MHDHETALYHFGTNHVECNVHLIRYLKKNTEDTKHKWADQMISLLCEANKSRKVLIAQGISCFSNEIISTYEKKYMELIDLGQEENKTTQHKYAKKDETKLLNRLKKYSHNYLLFLYNFAVSFDDNISEHLRKSKNRQKMAGGFRKDCGHEMYYSILTIIETLKRRKMGIIENIIKLFLGTPAIF